MRQVPIPGGTAMVRDPEDLTERQRRTIRSVMFTALDGAEVNADTQALDASSVSMKITPALGAAMFDLRDAGIIAGLVGWSLPDTKPTIDTVQDLPGDLYDALAKATEPLLGGMSVDFSPTPDAASPTPPSGDSGERSRAAETPTPQWSIGGASISTASSTT